MGHRKVMMVVGICIIISCVCGCGNSVKYKELSAPAIAEKVKNNYKIEKVKRGEISKELKLSGTLIPVKVHAMSFYTRGAYIKNLNVKDGTIVEKGQVLAELDTDSLKYRIGIQELSLKKMKLILENLMSSKAKERDIKSIQLDIENGEILLENLKKELANSKIISKVTGKVVSCSVKAGDRVRMNQSIMNIQEVGQMQVNYRGEQVDKLRIGMKAKIIPVSGSSVDGEVAAVVVERGGDGELLKSARINLEKMPAWAKLGESVEVIVELARRDNVIVIPLKYVRVSGKYATVQVWEKDDKVIRFVEIGMVNDSQVEVISGLSEGEEIVKFY